jgi:hypothetical protein
MKEVRYTCDRCGDPIDGKHQKKLPSEGGGFAMSAGGGELCILKYEGIMGHNRFPNEGLHYHYDCFCEIVDLIRKEQNA